VVGEGIVPGSWRSGFPVLPRRENHNGSTGVCVRFTSGDDRDFLSDERFDGAEVKCAVVRDGFHLG